MDKSAGHSLVLMQFMEIIGRRWGAHPPRNPWKVSSVDQEPAYCMKCFGVRTFDIVYAQVGGKKTAVLKRCRCCGAQYE